MTPLLLLALAAGPSADTWPGFRGDGTSRTAAKNLPVAWSPKDGVAWRIATTGYGQSAPVVWKDAVYLTAINGPEKETLIVAKFAAADGRKLWEKTFPASQKGKNNPMMSRAAGTPAADAVGVVALFESGDLIALTPNGSVRWQRSLGKEFGDFKNNHGHGSSPVQTADAVLVLVDHAGPSYLIAVNKGDGSTKWKADRPSRNSWTSPVVAEVGGKPVAVVSSGGAATGYDAATGAKRWEFDGLKGNTIASPTASGDVIVMAAGDDRMKPDAKLSAESNRAVRLSAGEPTTVWKAKKVLGNTASPLVHAGHAYFADKNGFVHCLDAATGEERYSERLDNPCWATPIGAGEHVYFFGKDGVTTVLKAGPGYEKVSSNRLWSAADFDAKKEAAKTTQVVPGPPPGKGPAGGPPVPKGELDAIRYSAVGDVVYGAAAVDGAFFLRTGTELVCVRR